jgi:4-hydroxybenzoate polyprenyltransferase
MRSKPLLRRLISNLYFARALVRWDQWYESKIPLFYIVGYTMFILHGLSAIALMNYIRLVLFSVCFLAFGYALNDYCDRGADLRAGKPTAIANLPSGYAILLLIILLGLGWLWLPFKNFRSIGLAALAYFFLAFYSLPPLRFKERGVFGLVAAAAAQRSLPAFLFFEAYQHWHADTLLFGLLYFFIGLRWIIGHQIWDFENDLKSGVITYTTQVGKESMQNWLSRFVFPAELSLLAGLVLYYLKPLAWLCVLFAVYLVWLWLSSLSRRRAGFPPSLFTNGWIPLADFYFIVWPLSLALYLALRQPFFWIVFGLNILWQHWSILNLLKNIWRMATGRQLLY